MIDFDIDYIIELLGFKEFLPNNWVIQLLAHGFCGPFPVACEDVIFLLCGTNSDPTHNLN